MSLCLHEMVEGGCVSHGGWFSLQLESFPSTFSLGSWGLLKVAVWAMEYDCHLHMSDVPSAFSLGLWGLVGSWGLLKVAMWAMECDCHLYMSGVPSAFSLGSWGLLVHGGFWHEGGYVSHGVWLLLIYEWCPSNLLGHILIIYFFFVFFFFFFFFYRHFQ